MSEHPYNSLPSSAFWRTGVSEKDPLEISGLWRPKFAISPTDSIVTVGSCFAQHIGKALQARGYGWLNAEPPPFGLPDPAQFNYGVFSFRAGNIYTTAMLRQWLECAIPGNSQPTKNLEIWEQDGRYFDALRPLIEPNGFASREEVIAARDVTFAAIRRALMADVFVFTLGLTEAWQNSETGLIYSSCPGTLAGVFDANRHRFVNFDYLDVEADLRRAIQLARSVNPDLRFVLTVSPVPLTATASGDHVLVATTYSKSVLRAVAGRVARDDGVDYFPSYEVITGSPFRAMFYAPNMREVTPQGVAHVMDHFFKGMERDFPDAGSQHAQQASPALPDEEGDVICEEMLLEAFNRNG